jgi:3-methyladenine DNA glycosylase Tag
VDSFKEIYRRAVRRHGGANLEAELPKVKSKAALRRVKDDRVLAEMTRGVFQAGFVWRVVENKWDGFEEAFGGFDPRPLAKLSENKLAALAVDTRIIRNPQKISSVRDNARLVCELSDESGSAARFFAAWPEEDMVGLWDLLKRRGSRLGGFTGQFFLRHIGVDTPMLTADVEAALREQGVVEQKSLSSRKAQIAIQEAFNTWREESGRSLSEISKILACSLGE